VIEEIEGDVEVGSDSEEYDEVIEVDEVEPEITLNALLGSPSPKTIRVISKINNLQGSGIVRHREYSQFPGLESS
jgi:hypothetical protein